MLFLRILGMAQKGSRKMVVAPAALTLTAPKGKPPTESIDEIRDSGLLTQFNMELLFTQMDVKVGRQSPEKTASNAWW